jgi:tetratricopeptide (TPR) repeat protein
MKLLTVFELFLLAVLISFTTGCLAWEPGWKQAQAPAAKGDVNALLVKAKKLAADADSREKVQQVINAYEEAVKIDPQNIVVLNEAGNYYFLLGYCYIDKGKDKESYYLKAIQYSERAMYTNPEFRALVDKGEPVWEACRVLKKNDMHAMYRWYMALGNCWNDCYCIVGRMLNCQWPGRAKKILEQMTAVEPDFYSGSIHFSWAAYYTILPGILGGDMKKAGEYYDKALALGPHMNNFYVARALYYHTKQKDRKGFVEDLHHALAIDPRRADSLEYAWAVWYRGKAMQLLKDIDTYFN